MALGKGLGAILEEVSLAYETELDGGERFGLESKNLRIVEIKVKQISPNPYQPRKHFDENSLLELSESIKQHGLLQPIVVVEKGDDYLLIAGERRLRAHKLAKIPTIKAIVAEVDIDSVRMRELALVENIQRENLNAIELANSYAELIDVHKITHEELSSIVHKSRSQITNTMRLLALSAYTQKQLLKNRLSQGHAKILVGLDDDLQKIIVDTVIGQKLSVRQTEDLVKRQKEDKTSANIPKKSAGWLQNYSSELKTALPYRFQIKSNRLEIDFKNETQIEEFIKIIKKN